MDFMITCVFYSITPQDFMYFEHDKDDVKKEAKKITD